MPPEKAPALPIPTEEYVLEEDLAPTISKILKGSYVPPISEAHIKVIQDGTYIKDDEGDFQPSLIGVKRSNELWADIKSERNSYVAIFSSEIWNDPEFVAERKGALEGETILEKFQNANNLFQKAVDRWFAREEKLGDKSRFAPQLKRFARIIDFSKYILSNASVAYHIKRGLITANGISSLLVEATEKEAAKQGLTLTPKMLEPIAARAFRNIGISLANTNIAVGPAVFNSVLATPGIFNLKKEGKSYVLTVSPEKMRTYEKDHNVKIWGQRSGMTTRCPAMYQIEGRSAVIPEYFKWMLEIIRSTADKK